MTEQFNAIRGAFTRNGWFQTPGAYVLVDGQYGSTGKGAAAALIGALLGDLIDVVTTNAGPNSGHTGYRLYPSADTWNNKILTQQIPVASVVSPSPAYLNAGAIINPVILRKESADYGFNYRNLIVHPNAAIIDPDHLTDDAESTSKIASTNKGVGRALARKVMREGNVAKNRRQDLSYFSNVAVREWDWSRDRVFVETAQGFSLGVNQPFYPYCTSRECTVGQALADAAIPASRLRKTIMCVRTFPIRVGNTDQGTSGGWYTDQKETTWEELGVEPELTTVTKRVRRVATWSRDQFRSAVKANEPDALFLNFMNYFKDDTGAVQSSFVRDVVRDYHEVMGKDPETILLGFGPRPEDVRLLESRK